MEYQKQISDDEEVVMNAPQAVIPGTSLPIQTEPTDSVVRNEVYPADVGGSDEEEEEKGIIVAGPGKIEMEYDMGPADATFMEEAHVAEPTVQISPLMTGLEEDPHSPKTLPAKVSPSNYQAKLTDPTGEGGKELDVDPILERLDNFHIHNKSQPHDHQIAPHDSEAQPEPESEPVPNDTITAVAEPVTKVASQAQPEPDSEREPVPHDTTTTVAEPVTEVATDNGHKVEEKVAGAGSAAAERGRDGGVSVKAYLAEKLRPGEEDKALSESLTGRFYSKKSDQGAENKEAMSGGGGGIVDRLKGAVGSWIGKSKSSGIDDSVVVVEEETGSEVKPQESGNDH